MKSQLEFPLKTPQIPDRNHSLGGRSFYFFDFDDNLIFLNTPLFLFHKITGETKSLSTRQFALVSELIGKEGEWKDFEIRLCPQTGSFQRFRQKKMGFLDKLCRKKQPLEEDLLEILRRPDYEWRGPSWNFFFHAVHNGRPLSIITARGHIPSTIQKGIRLLVDAGHLSQEPHYLKIFPVNNIETRVQLGDINQDWHTARLKQEAIRQSVAEAFRIFGKNPAHRFGMSDDDPLNLTLIIEVMQELKRFHPENSFFVIDTRHGLLVKQEVLATGAESPEPLNEKEQLRLFSD